MDFDKVGEFVKDLKKLSKKYRSISDDIELLTNVLAIRPEASGGRSEEIAGLGLKSTIIKLRRIACKSLKNKGTNTGLRLIYAYEKDLQKITFIEIYHKSDKANEDRDRIKKYFD